MLYNRLYISKNNIREKCVFTFVCAFLSWALSVLTFVTLGMGHFIHRRFLSIALLTEIYDSLYVE